ncbi:aminodeoxychorismate synthase component I [Alicyclobacillus acidocaldarius]|uniref:Para-aminobenzoate synthase, subunit I n=1 Tax=Alicyclobacillus acidocaldarius (strain Tc-4-1) TaxID=1048834 RepID=F8IHT6_ALIAT|nr:aminodeoxychorismate synthase component I [Alicyclobacillus acidocaldarius]AEJ43226.1 para-aminobenzoate synthase, subunit I [Alicyclobacillus acidocaldarius subsp. acidocaldarius Tc-4-1]
MGQLKLVYDFPLEAGEPSRRLVFQHPRHVWCAVRVEDVMAAMKAAAACAKQGAWVCGFVSYEAAPAFAQHLRAHRPFADLPLAWFAAFDRVERSGHGEKASGLDRTPTAPWETGAYNPTGTSPMWWTGFSQPHREAVDHIRRAIARGDVYQVNATGRIAFRGRMAPELLYEALRRSQMASYAAWLHVEPWDIVSVSPELFYRRNGRSIVTRPMKGTSPRARRQEDDLAHRAHLLRSEKERAENVMIVDLLRNDLGQIAVPGTVQVDRLFDVEAYPTVWQMTSTISCVLRGEIDTVDIFRALFPCGSVTGAPKAAAMQAIAVLERVPRGVYCGAIGIWTPDDREVWSVAIRTLVGRRDRGTWMYGTGSGVTWDSSPEREEAEVFIKAAVLERAGMGPFVELLETIRLDDQRWFLYEEHRDRVLASARTFGIPLEPRALDEAMFACAAEHPEGTWRVRLCVSLSGHITWEATPFEDSYFARTIHEALRHAGPRTMAMSPEPVDRQWIWLYHKTTDRAFYDRVRSCAPEAFDVLLYNEDGEVTEGTFGNIAYEIDGTWYTPPVECGLLPGALRSRLIRQGELCERVLHLTEIDRVRRWCWLNSLRGVIPVVLVDGSGPAPRKR